MTVIAPHQPTISQDEISELAVLSDEFQTLSAPARRDVIPLTAIAEMPVGPEKKAAVQDIVHRFRDAFGFDATREGFYGQTYSQAITLFARAELSGHRQADVAKVCAEYPEIRAADDRSRPGLNSLTLSYYTLELRAALNWASGLERRG